MLVVLAAGLALLAILATVVLAGSPLTVAATNSVPTNEHIELTKGNLSTCQPSGPIPQGTSAIRVRVEGRSISPAITVKILVGSRVFREGREIAGRGATPNVTVPVAPLTGAVSGARICTTVQPTGEVLRFYGRPQSSLLSKGSGLQGAALHMEYLRPGPKSWWSLISSIAYRMGLGHTPSGAGSVFLVLALMLAVVVMASRLTLKELQ